MHYNLLHFISTLNYLVIFAVKFNFMKKDRNTDEEALAIFAKVPQIVAKNNGFIIVLFNDETRIIGIYKNVSYQTSNSLPTSSLPSGGMLDLIDATGKEKSYDLFLIKDLD